MMTQDNYLQFAAMVAAAGAIALALHLIWRHALIPTYRFFVKGYKFIGAVAMFTEAQPVLLEIASEFRPNDGASLRDQVDSTNLRLSNIEGQMEQIVQHLGIPWNGDDRRAI